jgi:hypothetical protein
MVDRHAKINFAEMRDSGVRGILVYCTDYRCSNSMALMADHWPADLRLSDIEQRFVCRTCGRRGAGVRPIFNWNIQDPAWGTADYDFLPPLSGPFLQPAIGTLDFNAAAPPRGQAAGPRVFKLPPEIRMLGCLRSAV